MQRIANLRGNWKKIAIHKVQAAYNLNSANPTQVVEKVKKELKGLTLVYPRNSVCLFVLFLVVHLTEFPPICY
jgi:hypothetical protein